MIVSPNGGGETRLNECRANIGLNQIGLFVIVNIHCWVTRYTLPRFVLNRDGVDCNALSGEGFDVFDEVLGELGRAFGLDGFEVAVFEVVGGSIAHQDPVGLHPA